MKRAAVFFLSVSLLFLGSLPDVAEGEGRTLTIYYTGGVIGELEPCGCTPKTDFGGLPRRAGYIDDHRGESSPFLLVDAGNFSGEDTPQGRLKTQTMIRALAVMRYDAVALASREDVLPADLFENKSKGEKVPFLRTSGKGPATMTVERSGIRVRLSVDPEKTEERALNILLWDQAIDEANGEFGKFPSGWDVIILSDGQVQEDARRVGKTVVVSGYPKGERLGILTLHLDGSGRVVSYDHRWQPLGVEIRENEKVRQVLKEYDKQVAELYAAEEAKLQKEDGPYVGVEQCRQCHETFVESWKRTKHAGAWGVLERVGKTHDPECVRCHVVGFGESGGFRSAQSSSSLVDVQCEVCHGPGRTHLTDGYGPMREIEESICLRCHVPGHSPDFEYSSYRKKILHNP